MAALVGLSGCGFRPLYGTSRGGTSPEQAQLAAIDIALIPERAGQLLRQALQERFYGPGLALPKRYVLSVSFGIGADAISIQQDSTATRIREIGTATWILKQLDPAGTLVTSGTARSLDGVNVIDQQYFAADLASDAARRRISIAVADQMTLQIAAYFARRTTT